MIHTVRTASYAAAIIASPALAQHSPATGDAPPPSPATAKATAQAGAPHDGRQVYLPTDFARYAPTNAYDMLVQVPGFAIRDNEDRRGLGVATGNVLFNGQRPSNKADDMQTILSRIPAGNVERIEIVDGASLDIPGLSGQVANLVYRADTISGQFAWKPQFRAHFTDPLWTRADISVRGRSGAIEYEAALSNDEAERSGAGGPTLIRAGAGAPIERRRDVWDTHLDNPKLSARLTWTGADGGVANLGGHIQSKNYHYREDGLRVSADGAERRRSVRDIEDTWNYEISGDYQRKAGPGRLKLIGLRRFSHEPTSSEVVTRHADGSPDSGDCFFQRGNLAETIGRAEYQWRMLGGDWQVSGEAAFNALDSVARMGTLAPDGRFVEAVFDGGTGGVREDRYEGLISFGRKLTRSLSFQIVAGAEQSTIAQTGPDGLSRRITRPKGQLSLSWTPRPDFDASLKIRRRVLQLSFYDFLGSAELNNETENESNFDLRPQQDWSYEGEINKKLGRWGSTKFEFIVRDVEDRVDVIPAGVDGEAVGNIARAKAWAVISTSTITLDPAGLKGVRLDLFALYQHSSLRDPFTGERRQWNGFTDKEAEITLRHDIPRSNLAWGAGANYSHIQPTYRRAQVDRTWEGPVWMNVFAEHKDVMGLTLRATVNNVLNARSRRQRTVYTGLRGVSPIAFVEARNRLIGPIFSMTVRGTF